MTVPNDLILLYEHTTKSIGAYKDRQWKLAINATLLTGGLEYLDEKKHFVLFYPHFFTVIVLFGVAYSLILFFWYYYKIGEAREVLKNLYNNNKFSDDFRHARNPKGNVTKSDIGDNIIKGGFTIYIIILAIILFCF